MRGIFDNFRGMTGYELRTCPWRGFSDPVCGAVLDAVRMVGEGSTVALSEAGYPAFVIEGVNVYRSVVSAIHSSDMEVMRKRMASRGS